MESPKNLEQDQKADSHQDKIEAQIKVHNTGESMEQQIAEFENLDPYMLDNSSQAQNFNAQNIQDYKDYAA